MSRLLITYLFKHHSSSMGSFFQQLTALLIKYLFSSQYKVATSK